MQTLVFAEAEERRSLARTSLYVAASLYCDGVAVPVKIRNISTSGALLEIASTIPSGSLVQLVRGCLIVHALVSWSDTKRCGLKFSGTVDVQQWRKAPINAEQRRIDDVVRLLKAGAVPLPIKDPSIESADTNSSLFDDLQRASELIDQLGERLARDEVVTSLYARELQNIDIAMQVIAAVGASLEGSADMDTDRSKLASLRKSADQALGRIAAQSFNGATRSQPRGGEDR